MPEVPPILAQCCYHKKWYGKCGEIEATEDISPDSSENDSAMSGQNTSSDKETEFEGKENENDSIPIFNIFELLKNIDFLNLFLVPFLQGLGRTPYFPQVALEISTVNAVTPVSSVGFSFPTDWEREENSLVFKQYSSNHLQCFF